MANVEPAQELSFQDLPTLQLTDEESHATLPLGPSGQIHHGSLPNGLTYYVRRCSKPENRMCLALAVRVGSLAEEEHERGLAHVTEHLAFNATEKYTNHALVSYLESIGAEFGACQNAVTTADDTVYELTVPTDTATLEQTVDIVGQWASHIRCSQEDIDKERGAVLEEWRSGRNAAGRAAEAHWKLLMRGCKYADRLPIGLEGVIRNCSAATVQGFYKRWYRPQNMAVIAVGDVEPEKMVALIKEKLATCSADGQAAAAMPTAELAPHGQPLFSAHVDQELQHGQLHLTFLHRRRPVSTPAQFRDHLLHSLFATVLQHRLYRMSRRPDPPFFVASAGLESLTKTIACHSVSATVREGAMEEALQALLAELGRMRLHGVSERELQHAKATALSDAESGYIERHEEYSADLQAEYLQHWQTGDFVVDRAREAALTKTLIPSIAAAELQAVAQGMRSSSSCVVKAVSHKTAITTEALQRAVAEADRQEAAGDLEPSPEGDYPESILPEQPQPGSVAARREWPGVGATELTLSNGMRVCFKATDFLGDQVYLSGFAAGALSETRQVDFHNDRLAGTLAQELGIFGYPPEMLVYLLSGRRVDLSTSEGAYWRGLAGEQSPGDLETTFQLVHRLFTVQVKPKAAEDLQTVLRYMRESIAAQLREPTYAFSSRCRFINYGQCFYYQPLSLKDLDRLDTDAACAHHNTAFSDPSEWTLVLTGKLQEDKLLDLVQTYLASIPCPEATRKRDPLDVTPLPHAFPAQSIRDTVRVDMVNPQAQASITFPVVVEWAKAGLVEAQFIQFCAQLLEMRLIKSLRFARGQVYSVQVGLFFGCEPPKPADTISGDVSIRFSCDPQHCNALVEQALQEVEQLQALGPSQEEVASLRAMEATAHADQQQENSYWHNLLVSGYQSRTYQQIKDVDEVYRLRMDARERVNAHLSPESMQRIMCKCLPHPCRSRYTAITMLPKQAPSSIWPVLPGSSRAWTARSAGLFALGALVAGAGAVVAGRWWRQRRLQAS